MLPLRSQYPIAGPSRRLCAGLLAITVSLALGACGADDSFAPTRATPAPAEDTPASEVELINALSGTLQRIVFTSYRTGRSDVYSMDPQGGNLAHLTTTPNHDGEPSWSWDNKHIALVRQRLDGSNIPHWDIYLINADGSNGHWARPYASSWPLWEPAWSPDGSRIVVSIEFPDGKYLGLINLATGAVNAFVPAVKGTEPSYDPTGQRIVFVGSAGKTIEQINADGSGHKTRYSSSTYVRHPTFSPDGKKILFSRVVGTGNKTQIFMKNLTTGTTQRLTWSSASDFSPSWSPDGTRIAFASNRTGTYQIYTMSSTGGNVVRIKTAYGDWLPAWSH